MKTFPFVTSVIAASTMALLPVKAQQTYTGPGTADGGGANGEDISSVVVNNTAGNITFTINTSAVQSQPTSSIISCCNMLARAAAGVPRCFTRRAP